MGESQNDPEPKFEASVDELARGEDGRSRLVLPAMVMAELHGVSALGGGLATPAERERKCAQIRDYINATTFTPVEIDWRTAEVAGDLALDHRLQPGDALIAATALLLAADVLVTWDKKLLSLDDTRYPVAVRRPETSMTQQVLTLPPD